MSIIIKCLIPLLDNSTIQYNRHKAPARCLHNRKKDAVINYLKYRILAEIDERFQLFFIPILIHAVVQERPLRFLNECVNKIWITRKTRGIITTQSRAWRERRAFRSWYKKYRSKWYRHGQPMGPITHAVREITLAALVVILCGPTYSCSISSKQRNRSNFNRNDIRTEKAKPSFFSRERVWFVELLVRDTDPSTVVAA